MQGSPASPPPHGQAAAHVSRRPRRRRMIPPAAKRAELLAAPFSEFILSDSKGLRRDLRVAELPQFPGGVGSTSSSARLPTPPPDSSSTDGACRRPIAAAVASHAWRGGKGEWFPRFGLPPLLKAQSKAKGWRRCLRCTGFLRACFSRRRSPASLYRGRCEGELLIGLLGASRGPGADRAKCADPREKSSDPSARTRFEPIQRTGASPSFPRRLRRRPVLSLSLRFPFFEA